jgi:hypothetical protein
MGVLCIFWDIRSAKFVSVCHVGALVGDWLPELALSQSVRRPTFEPWILLIKKRECSLLLPVIFFSVCHRKMGNRNMTCFTLKQ